MGNAAYIALSGAKSFPTVADLPFFAMAVMFGAAILLYGRRTLFSLTLTTYNFVLLYGAVAIGTLFLMHHDIVASRLDEFGTIAAFLYPALWGSVAAMATMLLLLYPHGERRLPMALLVAALLAEAGADFVYASELMHQSLATGGWAHALWFVSAALMCWAAIEHLLLGRRGDKATARPETVHEPSPIELAAAPAVILFVVLITGTISGAFGRGSYQYVALVLTAVLTITVGLREHWIARTRRQLEHTAGEHLSRVADGEERLRAVLEATSDSVVVVDGAWRIRFHNQRARQFIPELDQFGVGDSFWHLFRPEEREIYTSRFKEVVRTGQPWAAELFNSERQLWVDVRVYPTGNGISLFFRDSSEERRSREELTYLAHHDYLTGLASRSVFSKRLADNASRSVMLLDLDSFKDINDTLGHDTGDAVLVEVARRLESCVPENGLVARLGGDEFALVLEDRSTEELADLSQEIIEAINRPIAVAGQSLSVGATIGIATSRECPANGDLFTRADIALYQAKAACRGRVMIFEPGMEAQVRERKALLTDLSRAVDNGELRLVYQPLLDAVSRRTVGFEALLRWQHPRRGVVSPADFIPLAEEGGLISAIGEWTLRTACAEAQTWPKDLSVSVNISTVQLTDAAFVEKVITTLEETGLDRRRLELEVTESALLRDANLPILQQLSDFGIRLALDDFGTGYSSLGYLQRIEFNKLKIDQSFIRDAPTNRKSTAIVRTVLDLARTLGMQVTAEGVETAEQFHWVAQNCDLVQGYFVARPMAPSDIPRYLLRESSSPHRLRA